MRLTPAKLVLGMFLVVGGLITAFIVKELLATDEAVATVETLTVPMPIADLKPGTLVTEGHLGQGRLRVTSLQPDILRSTQVIVGRVVKDAIPAASPIHSGQLFQPGERPPLALGQGMRAVSVSVGDNVSMVDGLISPGQYVDVHMTPTEMQNDARARGGLTLTLFKGVKVIAINQNVLAAGQSRGNNAITLELTPRQANAMILARDKGTITLTYNPEGRGGGGLAAEAGQERATLEEILGLQPLPQPAEPFVSEVFTGGARTTLQFRGGRRIGNDTALPPAAPSAPAEPAASANPHQVESATQVYFRRPRQSANRNNDTMRTQQYPSFPSGF